MKTICGANCAECMLKKSCGGCMATGGRPFGKECVLALCASKKNVQSCGECSACSLKQSLIAQFNASGIADMEELTELYALKGAFINMTYRLPGGQPARFWDDERIYLGSQLRKKNSDRCYGLAADEKYMMVCEYSEGGTDAELVLFRRWN